MVCYRQTLPIITSLFCFGLISEAAPVAPRADNNNLLSNGNSLLSHSLLSNGKSLLQTNSSPFLHVANGPVDPFSKFTPLRHRPGALNLQNATKGGETSNGTTNVPLVSVKDNLAAMLKVIGPDAEQRFVAADLDTVTAFGSSDQVASNQALSEMVDKAFQADPSNPGNDGWVDTYSKFLVEAGETNTPNSTAQLSAIEKYYSAWSAVQADLQIITAAYQKATGQNITNIGVNVPSAVQDPTSTKELEKWAQSSAQSKSAAYNSTSWNKYLADNKTWTQLTPSFQELNTSIQVAYQGNLLKALTAAVFNYSMIVSGLPNSNGAVYAPAWSAMIIDTTAVSGADAKDLQANIDASLHDGTVSNTSFASSVNNEAPPSTSAAPHASSTSHPSSTHVHVRADKPVKHQPSQQPPPPSSPHKPLKKANHASSALNVAAAKNSKNGTANNNDDNSLSGVSTSNLTGTMMLFRFQAGAWKNNINSYMDFARTDQSEVFTKYFGSSAPLSREWTHALLVTTYKPNSTDLQTVQIIGLVWDYLPGLGGGSTNTSEGGGGGQTKKVPANSQKKNDRGNNGNRKNKRWFA
ncbi:hypothetical protein D9757_002600 [Collybiopsis confluens]|uniref:Uncharacterized protein n=1 Tax=Collybiopsis confluens TaxID=2823264 RepID=A0A8H5HWE6_9AGAR|nr:hypothetical protein D9757_002600 [Collybiopsis confluens]